uniref:SAM-dependent MTase TRM10-type domain-containing protein n=1 Tax=Meloidogyne hapla TaxID=6305 RepID=A0A1I8BST7_MELHA
MGLTEQRDANDKERFEAKRLAKREKFMENLEKFERGEMVYGTPGYTYLYPPNSLTEFYYWNAVQLTMKEEMPRLLFDCQFLPNQPAQEYSRVLRSTGHAFYTNLESRMALPTSFINVNESDTNTKNLISKHIVHFKKNNYQRDRMLNPDFYRDDPFHDSKSASPDSDERDQVIYFSRYATETLKGPLIHKAYILPLTFDTKKETIGAIRRGKYRAMYFPIRDYIEWKCGGFKLAFVVITKILQEVASNGGDWKRALDLHVPIINRRTHWERKEVLGEEGHRLVNEAREERKQINEYIHQTIGNQPLYFEVKNQSKYGKILEEYADRLEFF